ncbi:MAG: EamA family transporter, partial [Terracidiphilus sp.]
AIVALLAGALSWTVGSILSRRVKLPVNSLVAASWQMLAAGIFNTGVGTILGQWPHFHLNRAAIGSLAWLVTGGSLLGYTGFIYLIEHVPVAKVTSYAYVNPVVAVLLGIFILHERPEGAEFIGMAAVVFAVFLLTSAQVSAKTRATVD